VHEGLPLELLALVLEERAAATVAVGRGDRLAAGDVVLVVGLGQPRLVVLELRLAGHTGAVVRRLLQVRLHLASGLCGHVLALERRVDGASLREVLRRLLEQRVSHDGSPISCGSTGRGTIPRAGTGHPSVPTAPKRTRPRGRSAARPRRPAAGP